VTTAILARERAALARLRPTAPAFAAGVVFSVLFWEPLVTLFRDWWTDSETGHGLLLSPAALYLAWRVGITRRRPQPRGSVTSDRERLKRHEGTGVLLVGIALTFGSNALRALPLRIPLDRAILRRFRATPAAREVFPKQRRTSMPAVGAALPS